MSDADYTLRKDGDVLIVKIEQDSLLGVVEVNRIGGKLLELIDDKPVKLVLDVTRVRYAGSAALGMLVSLQKHLQQLGGKLILAGTQQLETLFKASRTAGVFERAPDAETGLNQARG